MNDRETRRQNRPGYARFVHGSRGFVRDTYNQAES